MMEAQANAAMKLGRDLGLELAPAIFDKNELRITFLLQKRQRRLNICKEKWGEEVAKAFNKGMTMGLFEYAKQLAVDQQMPEEQTEAVITEWSAGLKERMEREQKEAEEKARAASAAAAGIILKP